MMKFSMFLIGGRAGIDVGMVDAHRVGLGERHLITDDAVSVSRVPAREVIES